MNHDQKCTLMECQKALTICQKWPRPNRHSCKEISTINQYYSARSAYYNVVCTEMIGHIDAHVKHAVLSNVKQFGNNK